MANTWGNMGRIPELMPIEKNVCNSFDFLNTQLFFFIRQCNFNVKSIKLEASSGFKFFTVTRCCCKSEYAVKLLLVRECLLALLEHLSFLSGTIASYFGTRMH